MLGSNILETALSVIGTYEVQYFKYLGKTTDSVGNDVPMYDTAITLQGSLQPVKKSIYEQYGLPLQKTYYDFYVSKDLLDIGRSVSGDKLQFMEKEFQCESSEDWFGMDGWVAMRCVLVKPHA